MAPSQNSVEKSSIEQVDNQLSQVDQQLKDVFSNFLSELKADKSMSDEQKDVIGNMVKLLLDEKRDILPSDLSKFEYVMKESGWSYMNDKLQVLHEYAVEYSSATDSYKKDLLTLVNATKSALDIVLQAPVDRAYHEKQTDQQLLIDAKNSTLLDEIVAVKNRKWSSLDGPDFAARAPSVDMDAESKKLSERLVDQNEKDIRLFAEQTTKALDSQLSFSFIHKINKYYGEGNLSHAQRAMQEYAHYAKLLPDGADKTNALATLDTYKTRASQLDGWKTIKFTTTLDDYRSNLYKEKVEDLAGMDQAKMLVAMDLYNKTVADMKLRNKNREYIASKTWVKELMDQLMKMQDASIVDIAIDKKTEKKMSEVDKAIRAMNTLPKDYNILAKENWTMGIARILGDINFDGKLDDKDHLGWVSGKQIAYAFTDAYKEGLSGKTPVYYILDAMLTSKNLTDRQKQVLDMRVKESDPAVKTEHFFNIIKNDPSLLIIFQETISAINSNDVDIYQFFQEGLSEATKMSEKERERMGKEVEKKLEEEFEKQTGKKFLEYVGSKETFVASFLQWMRGVGINETALFNLLKTKSFSSNVAVTIGGFANTDMKSFNPYMDISLTNAVKLWKNVTWRVSGGVGGGFDSGRFIIPLPHAAVGLDFKDESNEKSLNTKWQTSRKISPTLFYTPLIVGAEVELSIAGDRIEGVNNQEEVIANALGSVIDDHQKAGNDKTMIQLLKEKFPKTTEETLKKQAAILEQQIALVKESWGTIDGKTMAKWFAEQWRDYAINGMSEWRKLKSIAPGAILIGNIMPAPMLRATFTKVTDKYYAENPEEAHKRQRKIETGSNLKIKSLTSKEKLETLKQEVPEYVSVIENNDNTITIKLADQYANRFTNLQWFMSTMVADSLKDAVKIDPNTWEVTMPANIDYTIQKSLEWNKVTEKERKWFFRRIINGRTEMVSEAGDKAITLVVGNLEGQNAKHVEVGDKSYTGEKLQEVASKKLEAPYTQEWAQKFVVEKFRDVFKDDVAVENLDNGWSLITFNIPEGYDVVSPIWERSENGKYSFEIHDKKTFRVLKENGNKKIYIQEMEANMFAFGIGEVDKLKTNNAFPPLETSLINYEKTFKPRDIINARYGTPKAFNAFRAAMQKDLSDAKNLEGAKKAAKTLFPDIASKLDQPIGENPQEKLRATLYLLNGLLVMVATTENKWYSKDGKFDVAEYNKVLKELDEKWTAKGATSTAEMLGLVGAARAGNKIARARLMKTELQYLLDHRSTSRPNFKGYKDRMLGKGYTQSAANLYETARTEVSKDMRDDVGYGRSTVENWVALIYGYDGAWWLDEKFTTHPEIATKQETGEQTFRAFERQKAGSKDIIRKFLDTLQSKSVDLTKQFTAEVQKQMPEGITVTWEQVKTALIEGTSINGIPVFAEFGFAFYANCFNEAIVMKWLQVWQVDVAAEWVQAESFLGVWYWIIENRIQARQKDVSVQVIWDGIREEWNAESVPWDGKDPNPEDPKTPETPTSNPWSGKGDWGNDGAGENYA